MAKRSRKARTRRRKQSGGGIWNAVKGLFTRKAPEAAPTVVVNPLQLPAPAPVPNNQRHLTTGLFANAQTGISNIYRRENNAQRRERRNQVMELAKEANNERRHQNVIRNANVLTRQLREEQAVNENRIKRNLAAAREQNRRIEEALAKQLAYDRLYDDYSPLNQGGGGLTAAQIEEAVNNI